MGEGLTFTKDEVEKAAHVTYHIGTFSGVLGNVTSSQLQIGDYNAIHSELKRLGIPQKERNELEAILDEMPKAKGRGNEESVAKRGLAWVMRNAAALGALSDTIRGWFGSSRKVERANKAMNADGCKQCPFPTYNRSVMAAVRPLRLRYEKIYSIDNQVFIRNSSADVWRHSSIFFC